MGIFGKTPLTTPQLVLMNAQAARAETVVDTELAILEANVRPKIKEFMLDEGKDWHVCWIKLARDEREEGTTFEVQIAGPCPGEFIGPGGSIAADLCIFLNTHFHKRFYVNAKDHKFDPFSPIYEKNTPL